MAVIGQLRMLIQVSFFGVLSLLVSHISPVPLKFYVQWQGKAVCEPSSS